MRCLVKSRNYHNFVETFQTRFRITMETGFFMSMMCYFKVGTIFHDSIRVFKIQELDDDKIVLLNLKDLTIRTFEGEENIQWIRGYVEKSKFNEMFLMYLDNLSDSYPYVIQDLSGNIAVSKIEYAEYSRLSNEIEKFEDRLTFWEDNIRVIASHDVEDKVHALQLPKIYIEYFNLLHLWMNTTPVYTDTLSSIIYGLKMMPNFDEFTK